MKKKVKSIVILTSGFSESDEYGTQIQNQITDIVHNAGILLCGPNSQGIFNFLNGMSAGFAISKLDQNVNLPHFFGFISQNGGFGTAAYIGAFETDIGMSYFVSTGNEAGLDFSDYMIYMIEDRETRIIGGYLEGVKDGKKLLKAARQALNANKPVLLIKSGISEAAAKAAVSHTGSIVGSERVFQAFVKQNAIIRLESIEEFNMVNFLLAHNILPN